MRKRNNVGAARRARRRFCHETLESVERTRRRQCIASKSRLGARPYSRARFAREQDVALADSLLLLRRLLRGGFLRRGLLLRAPVLARRLERLLALPQLVGPGLFFREAELHRAVQLALLAREHDVPHRVHLLLLAHGLDALVHHDILLAHRHLRGQRRRLRLALLRLNSRVVVGIGIFLLLLLLRVFRIVRVALELDVFLAVALLVGRTRTVALFRSRVRHAPRFVLKVARVLLFLQRRLFGFGEHTRGLVAVVVQKRAPLPRCFRLRLQAHQRLLVIRRVPLVLGVHEGRQVGGGRRARRVFLGRNQHPPVRAVRDPLRLHVLPLRFHRIFRNRAVAHVVRDAPVLLVVRRALALPTNFAAERADDKHHRVARHFAVQEKHQTLKQRRARLGVLALRGVQTRGGGDDILHRLVVVVRVLFFVVVVVFVAVVVAVAARGSRRLLRLGFLVVEVFVAAAGDGVEIQRLHARLRCGCLRVATLRGGDHLPFPHLRHGVRQVVDHRDDARGVVLQTRVQQRRVPQSAVVVQLVVDEAHHGEVKLEKRQHHAVVHVLG
mmetsp:Transcript_8807/g.36919  ORF Transcript_8807/g.36919 Transcript_8807/m.36919 type:complete len:555 (-) Transcript_8807:800-2464(-)